MKHTYKNKTDHKHNVVSAPTMLDLDSIDHKADNRWSVLEFVVVVICNIFRMKVSR